MMTPSEFRKVSEALLADVRKGYQTVRPVKHTVFVQKGEGPPGCCALGAAYVGRTGLVDELQKWRARGEGTEFAIAQAACAYGGTGRFYQGFAYGFDGIKPGEGVDAWL